MTELEMLETLLNKTGRIYDKHKTETKTIIQIHVADIRYEWLFDAAGNAVEDWDNHAFTTWISEGAYLYE